MKPTDGSNELLCGSVPQDDEDETGRTPHRRVPARYVLRLGQVGGRYDNGGDYSDGDRSRDGNPGESRSSCQRVRRAWQSYHSVYLW